MFYSSRDGEGGHIFIITEQQHGTKRKTGDNKERNRESWKDQRGERGIRADTQASEGEG